MASVADFVRVAGVSASQLTCFRGTEPSTSRTSEVMPTNPVGSVASPELSVTIVVDVRRREILTQATVAAASDSAMKSSVSVEVKERSSHVEREAERFA
jgi:hypothetical protein